MKEIKLRVHDAKQRDRGRGLARIGSHSLKKLGVSAGDIIDIRGKRTTSAIAWPAYSEDQDHEVIRIDGFTRKNAGVAINKKVAVRPSKVENAQKIILAPIDMRLNVDEDFTNFVKNRIMERALWEGDKTLVMMLGHALPFGVIRTSPRSVPVRITLETAVSILSEPFSVQKPNLKVKTPSDIRYLLRFDWLNHVAARIKATKIFFSIPDHEISDTEEQKVIDAAQKIADQDLSNVRVEVSFESNGTRIGTLPWIDVDIYGGISVIYPNIQLPPPLVPSFTPRGTRGKVVPPMRRCFKTGVINCPKEINFSPKSVVVAMPFGDEFKDTYIYGVRPALEESGLNPWKADEQISNIDIMCKICQAIQESGYVLANITDWNPNVVFELGLAYGLGRSVILIKHKRGEVPVDLKGLEYIEYSTIDGLKRNLLLFLKGAASTK
jgi:hypothetical protein